MTQPKAKYPSAFYAAAGVGDLVYEQLRKLQLKAVEFGNEQAPQWRRRVADLTVKVDPTKVRETVVTGTQAAAERATKVYDTLVARGEKAFADEGGAFAQATRVKADTFKADTVKAATVKTDGFKVEATRAEAEATRARVEAAKAEAARVEAARVEAAKAEAKAKMEAKVDAKAKAEAEMPMTDAPVAKKAAIQRNKIA